jgi:hypothetical protein
MYLIGLGYFGLFLHSYKAGGDFWISVLIFGVMNAFAVFIYFLLLWFLHLLHKAWRDDLADKKRAALYSMAWEAKNPEKVAAAARKREVRPGYRVPKRDRTIPPRGRGF